MKNRALITGGAGFLGRHVAQALAWRGLDVTILDDLSSPSSTFDCTQLAHDNIRCLHGTILDRALTQRLISEHETIVHFASVVGVEHTICQTIPTMQNLEGSINVTEALTDEHAVIFGSSADVYGVHSHMHARSMREDDLMVYEAPEVNRWVYARIKGLEENLIANSPARSVNVRIFNSYGPGMDFPSARRVMPAFIERILDRKPLQISRDGLQRRAFCHVEDTVRGLLAALDHASAQSAPFTDTFNIGHDRAITIRDLAERIQRVSMDIGLLDAPLPIETEVELYSQTFDDTWHRAPNIDKARRVLGFEPRVTLEEGLMWTLRHYQQLTQNLRCA